MRKRNKAKAQRAHAARRVLERYGIRMSQAALEDMTKSIRNQHKPGQSRNAVFVNRESLRVTRWHVFYSGKWYPVVYDSHRGTIATVLPEGALGKPPDRPP